MNTSFKSLEEKFLVVALLFYSGSLSFDSFFTPSEGLVNDVVVDNPISSLLSIIQHGIFLVTFILLVIRWQESIQGINRNKFLWIFILLCLGSFLWSDFTDLTMRRSLSLLETTIFGLYFAVSFRLKKQLKLLAYVFIICMAINFLFTIAVPSSAIESGIHAGAWRGIFIQKNFLARSMVLATLIFLIVTPKSNKEKYFFWGASILAVSLVILSTSKTGILVLLFLAPLTTIYLRIFRLSSVVLIPLLLSIFLSVGGLITWGLSNAESILVTLGKNPSLSGRTVLWSALIDKIQERPLLGYGYVGFWQDKAAGSTYVGKVFGTTYIPPHSHNGFLELVLAFGLLGALLFSLSLISVVRRALIAVNFTKNKEGLFPLIYLSYFILYNLTESSLVEHNSIFWIIYVVLASSQFVSSDELNLNAYTKQQFQPSHHIGE
jgi:exopolysaccharide production protein ExoQ